MIRVLKTGAAFTIGLIGLLAFVNNLLNLETAHTVVSAVISAPEQPYYQVFGPVFAASWQGWLALSIIMTGELAVSVGELYFNMWQTEIGLGSVEGAFRYGGVSAILALLIAARDD
jgi:hypothetical protein